MRRRKLGRMVAFPKPQWEIDMEETVGMVVFGLFFWGITWGGACAILANNKGRNWFGWFILGAVFSLVALLVLGFLDLATSTTGAGAKPERPNETSPRLGSFHASQALAREEALARERGSPPVSEMFETGGAVSEKFMADLIAMLERDQGATLSDMCHELKAHPVAVTQTIEELRRRGLLIQQGSGISPCFSLQKTR